MTPRVVKFGAILVAGSVLLGGGYLLGVRAPWFADKADSISAGIAAAGNSNSGKLVQRYNGPECSDEDKVRPGQPKPYCGALPSLAALNVREARLQRLPVKLTTPWAFEFLDNDDILVTEFGGAMKRVDLQSGAVVELAGMPEIAGGRGQRGLLDVVLHPQYADNQLVYFSYATDNGKGEYATAVARAELRGDRLENVEQIFVALPYGRSSSNFGGALLFGRDGYLYIATGDRSVRSDAQHPDRLTGKIIRLNDDGSVPADNPFTGGAMAPAIYALGVRNPQGLAQDPVTGAIYETEHGPMGGDEVNLIQAGRNYGWPLITYGMNYTYNTIGEGVAKPGLEQPLFYYLPSIAVSPIAVYRGAMFPEWDGDLLVGALKGETVSKLDLVDGRVQSEYQMLGELSDRVRDIKVAADGSIWVLLQSGSLYRLWRESAPRLEARKTGKRSGELIYLATCAACHSQGVAGVPQLANRSDWAARLAKGRDVLYQNAIQGFNAMPEKGLCEDCTEKEVTRAVNFMLDQVK